MKNQSKPCYGWLPLVVFYGATGTAVSICSAQSNLSLQQVIFPTLLEPLVAISMQTSLSLLIEDRKQEYCIKCCF